MHGMNLSVTSFSSPAFQGSIEMVLCVRSEEQMPRIDARRCVARMANLQTAWDWAEKEFVSDAMRTDPMLTNQHAAVATTIGRSLPEPASASRKQPDASKEALYQLQLQLVGPHCVRIKKW